MKREKDDIHVIREHVRQQCRREMDTQSTKEEQATKKIYVRNTSRPVEENDTHKNGIQRKFSTSAAKKFLCPSRYPSSVNPRLPTPGKTTVHARRISKECR